MTDRCRDLRTLWKKPSGGMSIPFPGSGAQLPPSKRVGGFVRGTCRAPKKLLNLGAIKLIFDVL